MWFLYLGLVGTLVVHIVGIVWVRKLAALEDPPFIEVLVSWSTALAPIGLLAPILGLGFFVVLGAFVSTVMFALPVVVGGLFVAKAYLLHVESSARRIPRDTGTALILGSILPLLMVVCFLEW